MQIPFPDATNGNPDLALKPQAGIWIAEDLAVRDADESESLVGSIPQTW